MTPKPVPAAKGVIFPAELGFNCDGLILEYWTPGLQDVEEAERRLPDFLKASAALLAPLLQTLRRQYVGVVREQRRFVLLNVFPMSEVLNWAEQPVVVDDGGPRYFHLLYDVESAQFSALHTSGEA